MEIYKTPEFLIIHFKRFSHQRNTMFGSRKINLQIDFPVESLDMSSYLVEGPALDGLVGQRYMYDLYAISNHYGTLNAGHYTAFCKNPIANKWYEFDDSQVRNAGTTLQDVQNTVMTKAAYVLFYRRRK